MCVCVCFVVSSFVYKKHLLCVLQWCYDVSQKSNCEISLAKLIEEASLSASDDEYLYIFHLALEENRYSLTFVCSLRHLIEHLVCVSLRAWQSSQSSKLKTELECHGTSSPSQPPRTNPSTPRSQFPPSTHLSPPPPLSSLTLPSAAAPAAPS